MASSCSFLLVPPSHSFFLRNPLLRLSPLRTTTKTVSSAAVRPLEVSASSGAALQALIFDCDGVILESEHLHRQAYNDAFSHFNVRCPSSLSSTEPLNWGPDFYDELQNRIGGGKPKMRWYFKEHGWPISTIFEMPPEDEADRTKLIDTLQDWKTERYKEIIKSGTVKPRPGVLRLMDDTKVVGKKLAVCSAATKSSVVLCLENLIGIERFSSLDCFLAGDDVKEKKPDPSIYLTAAEAARSAGMPCIITYTSSTANQDFKDAIGIYPDLGNIRLQDLESLLYNVAAD